jgi:hypothetical protein
MEINRLLSVITTLLLGCVKLPPDEGGVDESAVDSTDLSEAAETVSETGNDSGCEPGCVCYPPEFVCVAADSEVNFESRCAAAYSCSHVCYAPYCEDVGGGECEVAHEEFTASASQTCIDLLLTAETCHFGLTCAELVLDRCDPAHACYQPWLAFREAGCDVYGAPNCE